MDHGLSIRRILPALRRAGFLLVVCAAVSGLRAQSYTTAILADGFDYPVGKPNAYGYYVYRGFTQNGHLGEDWNGNGGGNTDEGDPVYNIAHGVVVFSQDYKRGWGNVVIVRHAYRGKDGQIAFVDSLYGHLKVRMVREGERVTRGQQLGTIGRGPYNMYAAHLHFEIRKDLRVGMHRTKYPRTYATYYAPRYFLDQHRKLRYEARTVRMPINTFLRSNPNRVETDDIDVPEIEGPQTIRPVIPEEIEAILEEQTSMEDTEPEKSKSIFERIFSTGG